MRKLPNILKRIIKKKTFSLNSITNQNDWRGGMKIDYRITMVKACEEENYEHLTPLNNEYGTIYVNIKVKGMVQMRARYDDTKTMVEIGKATKSRVNYWGGYDTKYDSLWGSQVNKKIRRDIRVKTKNDVRDFLKLMGITTERWSNGIEIKTITWEK